MSLHNSILPQRTHDDVKECYTIHYIVKPGNAKGHVVLRAEDENYIYHWLNRLVADVCSKQFIDSNIFDAVSKLNHKELPRSTLHNTGNSLLSYAGGLLSNKYRNPSEDFTQSQLSKIEFVFACIYAAYGEDGVFTAQDLGYDFDTRAPNEPPQRIKFVEV